MKQIRLGIIGTADIAFRRFLPSLMQNDDFKYMGVASRNYKNTEKFIETYGGKGFGSYEDIINNYDIDAVYIPLPPALHYEWAMEALKQGKHVFLEKPFTTKLQDTCDLIDSARKKGLALHENYMFQFHSQIKTIQRILTQGLIGELRNIRCAFGFPIRVLDDFRYKKELGGGALLDCGGYVIRLASLLLGPTARITAARLNYLLGIEVDMYGSVTLENNQRITAQVCYGMDNAYKCELELWGSKGYLKAPRIFTAPPDFAPDLIQIINNSETKLKLEKDDQFLNSIKHFSKCVNNQKVRENNYDLIKRQSCLIQEIMTYRNEEVNYNE